MNTLYVVKEGNLFELDILWETESRYYVKEQAPLYRQIFNKSCIDKVNIIKSVPIVASRDKERAMKIWNDLVSDINNNRVIEMHIEREE